MKKRVHYLCFGVDNKTKDRLIYFPSAQPKIRYIADTVKNLEYELNIVSSCSIKNNGIFFGRSYKIDKNERRTYFSSFKTPVKFLNKVSVLLSFIQLIIYCLFFIKKGDSVIVYHSLYYLRPLKIVQKIKKIKFILEVEEIYSCLSENNKKFYKSEIAFMNSASGYLLVNDLIDEKITRKNKPAIISYGNYSVPQEFCYKNLYFNNSRVNVVYAGVIENIRKAAYLAVDAAKYLNSNYRLHILGFGNKGDIETLKSRINEINLSVDDERVVFHGEKSGEEYYGFLQACDIALSCHIYEEEMKESADYTFPSKLLTYMANGLTIVSSNIRCVKNSVLGNYMHFFKTNSSKEMADVILSIDLNNKINSRKIIEELDVQFTIKMKKLLKRREYES